MGRISPTMYSIQFRTVESWKGCRRDSSSQKKPRLYGSPHRKKNRMGKPTVIGEKVTRSENSVKINIPEKSSRAKEQ